MTFNSKLTKLLQAKRAPVLFLDFDGTVSTRDAIDLMLERFADEKWIAVEERWKSEPVGRLDPANAGESRRLADRAAGIGAGRGRRKPRGNRRA